MSHHIPSEIIIEILTRLPVKSLIRFRLVCKHWYSIITNPSFITTHLNRFSQTTTDQFLISLCEKKGHFLLISNNENFYQNYVELEFPFNDVKVVGSCNGLICLIRNEFRPALPKNLMIWNPCIRKLVTLSSPKTTGKYGKIVIGFGFDLVENNMFKVVRIMIGKDSPPHNQVDAEVEVYDQRGGEWRPIGFAPPHYKNINFWETNSQVFFRGAVHWVASFAYPNWVFIRHIVAFDMGDEVFREIALPRVLSRGFATIIRGVSLFKDSLVVFASKGIKAQVWMMREYGVFESWTNLYSIDLPREFNNPLGFRKNGEILFAPIGSGLASYDPETKRLEKSGINENILVNRMIVKFNQSLVLLV